LLFVAHALLRAASRLFSTLATTSTTPGLGQSSVHESRISLQNCSTRGRDDAYASLSARRIPESKEMGVEMSLDAARMSACATTTLPFHVAMLANSRECLCQEYSKYTAITISAAESPIHNP